MNAPVAIKGWCPTALTPMTSGDGLIVRVRIRDATLTPQKALALAELARRYGNGLIDMTQRASLQIRGVRENGWPALTDELRGLGMISAADDAGQAVNIVIAPLAGLDGGALIDARPLADAIERGLLADDAFRELPSKFGFAIDDGGALPLGDTGADITLTALVHAGDVRVAVVPGESPDALVVSLDDAAGAALDMTKAFLRLRNDERRMRALVARVGPESIFADAISLSSGEGRRAAPGRGVLRSTETPTPSDRTRLTRLRSTSPEGEVGLSRGSLGATQIDGRPIIGVAAAFGAWTADDLACVSEQASLWPGASLRVTPWRAILLADLPQHAAIETCETFAKRGLIIAPDDPRLSVAACAGAPACHAGAVETRALARDIARELPASPGLALHVSGCAKGCAHPHSAPLTLVGRDGRYDLVVDGSAGDAPFLAGLDAAAALDAVRRLAR